jgi:hypothetical protein
MFQIKIAEKVRTHSLSLSLSLMGQCEHNILQPDRPQMTVWCMQIACRIAKSTNTHSEYVIIIAFPLQQHSHENSLMLRYTYIACRVVFTGGCVPLLFFV